MRAVILAFPNGAQVSTPLADVPRQGDLIRQKGNGETPTLIVERVQWCEGEEVVVFVREEDKRGRP